MTLRKLLAVVGLLMLTFVILDSALPLMAPAQAVEPEEVLDDPVLEAEAREISQLLRCLVCQNQSIDESNAGLARDLRRLVRERLVAGDTREETLDYIVSRYGDYVRLKPPVKRETLALWWAPAIFAALAILGFVVIFTRGRAQNASTASDGAQALTPEEQKQLKRLLKKKENPK